MIDTHTHLYLCDPPVSKRIQNALAAGVTHCISVSIDLETTQKNIDLAREYPCVLPTVGVHPSSCDQAVEWEKMAQWLATERFYAIGEIGLDYHWTVETKARQQAGFERQLQLAFEYQLPVIIHNRKADEDVLAIVKKYPQLRYVFHCFSSDGAFVDALEGIDAYFSFTGMITYSKKGKVIDVIRNLPLDRMMVETDCPYLTPEAYRGQKNEPAYLGEVVRKIAEIKGETPEKIAAVTAETSRCFFNIDS